MSHPLLQSTYAAARRHLVEARKQEHWALGYASTQYMGGHLGRTARRLYVLHDGKRATSIRLALECRTKAKRLRVELGRLAHADTMPAQVFA